MKIITINVPDTHLEKVQEFQDLGLYQSRSDFYREAIKEHIEHLKQLEEELKVYSSCKIITVNIPSEHLAEVIDLLPKFYKSAKNGRSEFMRDAGLRLIEKKMHEEKVAMEEKPKSFDEELQEWINPIKNEQYKAYKIVKGGL